MAKRLLIIGAHAEQHQRLTWNPDKEQIKALSGCTENAEYIKEATRMLAHGSFPLLETGLLTGLCPKNQCACLLGAGQVPSPPQDMWRWYGMIWRRIYLFHGL
jgi:hypothetical protein